MLAGLLTELETRLAGHLRRDAQDAGLLEATSRVLLALEEREALPMARLAERVGRDATTATRFVNRAEKDGLLTRRPGARDKRRRLATLTEAGREARARLVDIRERRTAIVLEQILAETGLHAGQVEWFLASMLEGMRGGSTPESAPIETSGGDAPAAGGTSAEEAAAETASGDAAVATPASTATEQADHATTRASDEPRA